MMTPLERVKKTCKRTPYHAPDETRVCTYKTNYHQSRVSFSADLYMPIPYCPSSSIYGVSYKLKK